MSRSWSVPPQPRVRQRLADEGAPTGREGKRHHDCYKGSPDLSAAWHLLETSELEPEFASGGRRHEPVAEPEVDII